jgi:hypothetical protein
MVNQMTKLQIHRAPRFMAITIFIVRKETYLRMAHLCLFSSNEYDDDDESCNIIEPAYDVHMQGCKSYWVA